MDLAELLPREATVSGLNDPIDVRGITADSRAVKPGYVFAAIKGVQSDGNAYVADALNAGAVAVLTDLKGADYPAPTITVEDARRGLSEMAAKFYPAQPETIAAVTGTAGKTSVAAFLRQIWQHGGKNAASIGTVGVVSPFKTEYGSLTTPDPVVLHRTIDELARNGVTHLALEASSHGLDQARLDGVRVDIGAFTNLGRDHMDYHDTIEEYFDAKMGLFERLLPKDAPFVVDLDSPYGEEALERGIKAGLKPLTVGSNGEAIRLVDVQTDGFKQILSLDFGGDVKSVALPLAGRFQVSNALVAGAMALASGLSADDICQALENLKGEKGRLEFIGTTARGALVFVDYAHKVEALDNVLDALRPYATHRLISVFGAGGDRDQGKRKLMGEVSAEKADITIVTDDNPRSENPASIRAEILKGVPDGLEIGDREAAIRHAVVEAGSRDVVVIAGKGHETGQIVGDKTLPFSDHEVAEMAITASAESDKRR